MIRQLLVRKMPIRNNTDQEILIRKMLIREMLIRKNTDQGISDQENADQE